MLVAAVPGQMVGGDVEHHSHIGSEVAGGGQLIAGHLGHVDLGAGGGHGLDARIADVAHGHGI